MKKFQYYDGPSKTARQWVMKKQQERETLRKQIDDLQKQLKEEKCFKCEQIKTSGHYELHGKSIIFLCFDCLSKMQQ
jgi:hypothetical protein